MSAGYGFAIGNVAAFDMEDPEAVVSPGGVGFDINCGVRLLRTNLHGKEFWRSRTTSLSVCVSFALSSCMYTEAGVCTAGLFCFSRQSACGVVARGCRWCCWPSANYARSFYTAWTSVLWWAVVCWGLRPFSSFLSLCTLPSVRLSSLASDLAQKIFLFSSDILNTSRLPSSRRCQGVTPTTFSYRCRHPLFFLSFFVIVVLYRERCSG